MKLLKNYSFLAGVLLVTQFAHAQQAFSASGVEATGSGGSASSTVGQLFSESYTATTGAVSQGMQQPFEFQVLSAPEITTVNLTAATYPNPTNDFIILKITDRTVNNLQYTLFDVNGRAIVSHAIAASSTQIQMKDLAIGVYVLKVSQQNKPLKTFKILKKQ